MIDKRLYCETFSRLCASEEAKKEVFQMMNEKKNARRLPKLLRGAAIAAVMAMALAVTAGAADLATGGTLFDSLRQVWSDGYETRYEAVDQDGNQIILSVSEGAYIEKRDDGKVMVLCAAGEEIDITERLTEDGAYHFEKSLENHSVEVDVTGGLEAWEMTETVPQADGSVYTNHFNSDDVETGFHVSTAVAVDTDGESDENGVVNSSVVTVTNVDVEDILVTDSAKSSFRSGVFTVEPAGTPEEP